MSTTKELVRFNSEKEIQARTSEIMTEVKSLQIDSQPKYQQMTQLAHWTKLAQKAIEDYFEPMVGPAYQAWKSICDKRSEAIKPLKDAEALAKQRMRGWMEVQARKAAEATAKQTAKAEEKGVTPPPPVANKAKVEGVQYQENYEVEISDWDAFVLAVAKGKLPRNFLAIQIGEVKRYANATKGQAEIPGVTVTRKDIVKMT